MANKLVADSFETLGGVVKQAGDDIAENIGLKPQSDTGTSEQSGQPQQQAQADQIKKYANLRQTKIYEDGSEKSQAGGRFGQG